MDMDKTIEIAAESPNSFSGRIKTRSMQISPHLSIGGSQFLVIAGPCAVESDEQFQKTALWALESGAQLARGGIYKMRTNPDSFQGLGSEALNFVAPFCRDLGMPLVTEVSDPRQIEAIHDFVDVFQVGTRNMYNYSLLAELGKTRKPVLLKRAFSAQIDEWLMAAEYIRREGNPRVILCERGIRTFEKSLRNTLDLSAVAYIKTRSELPVIVDPSHATGNRDLVKPMALASIAAGADGLLIETHPNPVMALSDADQALSFPDFKNLMNDVKNLLPFFGKHL